MTKFKSLIAYSQIKSLHKNAQAAQTENDDDYTAEVLRLALESAALPTLDALATELYDNGTITIGQMKQFLASAYNGNLSVPRYGSQTPQQIVEAILHVIDSENSRSTPRDAVIRSGVLTAMLGSAGVEGFQA